MVVTGPDFPGKVIEGIAYIQAVGHVTTVFPHTVITRRGKVKVIEEHNSWPLPAHLWFENHCCLSTLQLCKVGSNCRLSIRTSAQKLKNSECFW